MCVRLFIYLCSDAMAEGCCKARFIPLCSRRLAGDKQNKDLSVNSGSSHCYEDRK